MRISADDVQRTYEYLCTFKPFNQWDLPDSAQVHFEVNKSEQFQGEYDVDPHTIKVSSYFCTEWIDVVETVAHEIVHLKCERAGHYKHADHDRQFLRLAKQVCKAWGWKIEDF